MSHYLAVYQCEREIVKAVSDKGFHSPSSTPLNEGVKHSDVIIVFPILRCS